MSVKISSMVWERLGFGGGELLLAHALADRSDDLGGSLFESVRRLARKTRQSERTVRRQLAMFRSIGWLQVVKRGGMAGQQRSATRYQINPLWVSGHKLSTVPEAPPLDWDQTPANLSGVDVETATGGIRPLSPVAVTPDTAVSPKTSISIRDPKSARTRASPTGSRLARQLEAHEARLAKARALLAQVPDYPLDQVAKLFSLTEVDLATVTASSAEYSGGGS